MSEPKKSKLSSNVKLSSVVGIIAVVITYIVCESGILGVLPNV